MLDHQFGPQPDAAAELDRRPEFGRPTQHGKPRHRPARRAVVEVGASECIRAELRDSFDAPMMAATAWAEKLMITMKIVRPLLAMALLGLALGLPVAAMAQATKAGWWIRVDTKKTEADGIGLTIGTSARDRREWRSWRAKDAAEFDLPADLAQAAVLHLRAIAIPDDEDVWFCVYFKGQGVRHFDFDTQVEATMKPTDKDGQCR